MRTAILALVVLAMSRPFLDAASSGNSIRLPTHHVIAVDATLSMRLVENGRPRFETARELARGVVASSPRGDAFNLLRHSRDNEVIIRQTAWDSETVQAEVESLQCTWDAADAARLLEDLQTLVETAPGPERKAVHIFSDFQQHAWKPADRNRAEQIRERLRTLCEAAEVVLVNCVADPKPNIAVTELTASPGCRDGR